MWGKAVSVSGIVCVCVWGGGVKGVCWADAVCGNLLTPGGEYILFIGRACDYICKEE